MDDQAERPGALKPTLMIVTALWATYGRKAALDVAILSEDLTLKMVALTMGDPNTAGVLAKDLAQISDAKGGSSRALDKARYDTPQTEITETRLRARNDQCRSRRRRRAPVNYTPLNPRKQRR